MSITSNCRLSLLFFFGAVTVESQPSLLNFFFLLRHWRQITAVFSSSPFMNCLFSIWQAECNECCAARDSDSDGFFSSALLWLFSVGCNKVSELPHLNDATFDIYKDVSLDDDRNLYFFSPRRTFWVAFVSLPLNFGRCPLFPTR